MYIPYEWYYIINNKACAGKNLMTGEQRLQLHDLIPNFL